MCEEPKCSYECKKPGYCPKPACKLECEKPKSCTDFQVLKKLPPIRKGESAVVTFDVGGEPVPGDGEMHDLHPIPGCPAGCPPGMMIFIKNGAGEQLAQLSVKASDTICDVKNQLSNLRGIPPEEQTLTFEGKIVDEARLCKVKLEDVSVMDGSILILIMKIMIRWNDGGGELISEFYVPPSSTCGEVKNKLQNLAGIQPELYPLSFDGKDCDGELILKDLGVMDGSILILSMMIMIKWNTPGGEMVTQFNVKPSNTCRDVKNELQNLKGIPPEYYPLSFAGEACTGQMGLQGLGVKNGSILILTMMIMIKWNDVSQGEQIAEFSVKPSDTCSAVKKQVQNLKGIAPEDYPLSFDSKDCNGQQLMGDLGVKHGSVLILMMMIIVRRDSTEGELIAEFYVMPSDTIRYVKRQVLNLRGIPPEDYTLRFEGQELQDPAQKLEDIRVAGVGIKHLSILILIVPEVVEPEPVVEAVAAPTEIPTTTEPYIPPIPDASAVATNRDGRNPLNAIGFHQHESERETHQPQHESERETHQPHRLRHKQPHGQTTTTTSRHIHLDADPMDDEEVEVVPTTQDRPKEYEEEDREDEEEDSAAKRKVRTKGKMRTQLKDDDEEDGEKW
jgi:hypothetical protein